MRSGFIDKLIERIRRVQPEEVQNYLVRLAREKGFLEEIKYTKVPTDASLAKELAKARSRPCD